MSWSDEHRRDDPLRLNRGLRASSWRKSARAAGTAAALAGALFIAGCSFQPLYGDRGDGSGAAQSIGAIGISQISGRVGQRLRNQLIFLTTGGQEPFAPEYQLDVSTKQTVRSIVVRVDGDARGKVFILSSTFSLRRIADKAILLESTGTAQAAFESFDEIYADRRARIDAENRAADELARSIQIRVAAAIDRADPVEPSKPASY
ncbi:MAG: hypothetical protein AAFO79_01210 [Pseudomonadota bacterium]